MTDVGGTSASGCSVGSHKMMLRAVQMTGLSSWCPGGKQRHSQGCLYDGFEWESVALLSWN